MPGSQHEPQKDLEDFALGASGRSIVPVEPAQAIEAYDRGRRLTDEQHRDRERIERWQRGVFAHAASRREKLEKAREFANTWDAKFKFGPASFGLDALIGLIPGLGDWAGKFAAWYMLWLALTMNVHPLKILLMFCVLASDALLGHIPLIGDLGDMLFKANRICLHIIEWDMERLERSDQQKLEGPVPPYFR